MKRILAFLPITVLAGAVPAAALTIHLPAETSTLKPGPGRDAVKANCAQCHSLDYITTQPPGMGHGFWQSEVEKMMQTYGASVDAKATDTIVTYLSQNY